MLFCNLSSTCLSVMDSSIICMTIPVTVRYNFESVANLHPLPENLYVHLKHAAFKLYTIIFFQWLNSPTIWFLEKWFLGKQGTTTIL